MSSSILSRLEIELIRYGMTLVLVLGVIGNFFVIIFFSQRRQNSCAMYITGAAVLNTCAFSFLIPLSINNIHKNNLPNESLIFCKLCYYLPHRWSQVARYLMALAFIDRYILTTNNVCLLTIQRPMVVRWIISIVIIFYHIFLIHLAILTTIKEKQCGQFDIYQIVYEVHVLIFLSLIPITLMFSFGYLAYRNTRRLYALIRPVIKKTTDIPPIRNIHHHRERDLLIMILTEVFVYVLTMFFYPFILLETTITTYLDIKKSGEHIQIESFLSTIASLLIHINSAIPFYLYMIVSKSCRKDFKGLATPWKHRVIGRQ